MYLYGDNAKHIQTMLKNMGYKTHIKVQVSYVKLKQNEVRYFLEFDNEGVLYDNITYGSVRTQEGYSKKIGVFASNNNLYDKKFLIPDNILNKIEPSLFFYPNVEVQKKLLEYYLDSLSSEKDKKRYNFLLKMPALKIRDLGFRSVNEFYQNYRQEFEKIGISIISLYSKNASLSYLATSYAKKKELASFTHGDAFSIVGNISIKMDEVNINNQLDELLVDFFNTIAKKISAKEENNLDSWLNIHSEKMEDILKSYNNEIFSLYRKDKEFRNSFNIIKNANILNDNSIKLIKELKLENEILTPFFVTPEKIFVEYININNGDFFKNIPSSLKDYFTNKANILKLFKNCIENATNVTVVDMLTSTYPIREDNKSMVMLLESDTPINKFDIQNIIMKAVEMAVKCESNIDIENSIERISLSIFQDLLLSDSKINVENTSKVKKF